MEDTALAGGETTGDVDDGYIDPKGVMEYDSPRPSGTQGRATLNHQPQNLIWTKTNSASRAELGVGGAS